jgi:hypothetical protein
LLFFSLCVCVPLAVVTVFLADTFRPSS